MGERLDLHTGGVDNIFPHHEGELAQSEAAYGGPYVRIWVHGQHLLADGVKMAKSTGNSYILSDLVERGIDPLAFRYLCATAQYRARLNFTFAALKAAQRGYTRLRRLVQAWAENRDGGRQRPSVKRNWRRRFWDRVDADLGIPQALATLWSMAHSDLNPRERAALAVEFDRVLGLDLARAVRRGRPRRRAPPRDARVRAPAGVGVSSGVRVSARATVDALVEQRDGLRRAGQFQAADALRAQIREAGFGVEDRRSGTRLVRLTPFEIARRRWPTISSPSEVPLNWGAPDAFQFTVGVQANGFRTDVERCLGSVLRHAEGLDYELLVLDNYAPEDIGNFLEDLRAKNPVVRVLHADMQLGEAAAKNVLLRQALGRTVVLLETHVELTGDLLGGIEAMLAAPDAGVAGPYGLRSGDLHHFHEVERGPAEADAMQAYCFGFKRRALPEIGHLPESYRFYRNLDLDFSFRFRDRGYRVVADPALPVVRHEHRAWSSLGEAQREELSRANFKRFTRRWGKRTDLLVGATPGPHPHRDGPGTVR